MSNADFNLPAVIHKIHHLGTQAKLRVMPGKVVG